MRNAHLVIGEITKPQGVRGELKLRPITCDLGRFEDLKTAYLKRRTHAFPCECGVAIRFTFPRSVH